MNARTRSVARRRAAARIPIAVAAAGLLLGGCSVNPYTKRTTLVLQSDTEDAAQGAAAYEAALARAQVSRDPRETEPVKRVAERIIAAAKRSAYADLAERFDWEVTVVKDDRTLNAGCYPGGKIIVYTGIFPAAADEAGLAAILGHEVTHALARHGAARKTRGALASLAIQATDKLLARGGARATDIDGVDQTLVNVANVGMILPFGRDDESEADHIGLLLAADAGYDPFQAIRVWQRMEKLAGRQRPEFLSIHPSHAHRIEDLERVIPEAMKRYAPPPGLEVADLPPIGDAALQAKAARSRR